MTIESINIEKSLRDAESMLENEKGLSPAFVSSIKLIFLIVRLLANKLGLNSNNSSKPPSSDPNRKKRSKGTGQRKPGGQNGHKGSTLFQVEDPDKVVETRIDKRTLPKGRTYTFVGWDKRQVFDIEISRYVTEYRAEILEDEHGNRFTAAFADDVKQPAQYGNSVKASAVYMSMFQMIPYERLRELFEDQFGIPLSSGSLVSFNQEAARNLNAFEQLVKHKLAVSDLIHVDETGVNIGGKRYWLHNASNEKWIWISPHKKRGKDAMDEIGILKDFKGTMVHDHWKPYYKFDCLHSLCNAHHLRELTRAFEQDGMEWAQEMESFLVELNKVVNDAGGVLEEQEWLKWKLRYRDIINSGHQECPPPPPQKDDEKKRGKQAKSKARNLLERLQKFEEDVLRFMTSKIVPFTNNMAERDLRMSKVHQKISGCFRSMEGAETFSTIRSFLATCRKNNVCLTKALEDLFAGKLPDFIQDELATSKKMAE